MKLDFKLPLTGSCQCGNVTYRADDAPLASLACHCIECQKLSASVYSTVLIFKSESIKFFGELKTWERSSDSGRRNVAYFCPNCGNRMYHFDPDNPLLTRLKSGTLDSQEIPPPQINQWTSRKPSWVEISDNLPNYSERMSPDERKQLVGIGYSPTD